MAQEETSPAKSTAGSKRDRSPNYPSMTFTEALAATRKIWDKEKRHLMSADLASQHLGYKKTNGVTLPMLAAMKKYGLIVTSGKEVRVSDDANTIFLYPEGSPESLTIIKRLAVLPSLFVEVLAKFPDGLPSDANLRARLQTEWRFATQKAADNFIKALREAVTRLDLIRSLHAGTEVAREADDALAAVKRIVKAPTLRMLPTLDEEVGDQA